MKSGCSAERGKAHGKRQGVRWISAACLREGMYVDCWLAQSRLSRDGARGGRWPGGGRWVVM